MNEIPEKNVNNSKISDQFAQATIRALPRMSWERAEALSSSRVRIDYDDYHDYHGNYDDYHGNYDEYEDYHDYHGNYDEHRDHNDGLSSRVRIMMIMRIIMIIMEIKMILMILRIIMIIYKVKKVLEPKWK